MKRIILLFCLLLAVPAFAQSPVLTVPVAKQSTNAASTVAVTNTFQSIQIQTSTRTGCTVQNNSASNVMYVFFGPIGSATLAKSIKLATTQALNCNVGGVILTDQISITGTAGDVFYANLQ